MLYTAVSLYVAFCDLFNKPCLSFIIIFILGLPVTEYQTLKMRKSMDMASINVAPMRGNIFLKGGTVFVFQHGSDLECYVEEFLDICHRAACDDVCLMEGFRCGLDEDLRFVMPRGDPCWSLLSYINFALWTNGSTFTVGEVEDDSSLVQPHRTDVAQPDPEHRPPTSLTKETTMPEPPADGELLPATTTEPVTTAPNNAPEPKPLCESDQGCEPAIAVPVGILVDIDSGEDWLINWDMEILLPTLPHPDIATLSSSSLVLASAKTDFSPDINCELSSVIPTNLNLLPTLPVPASPPAVPQLDACSPSSSLVMPCSDVKPQVMQSPASPKAVDPLAPPPASDPFPPPRPVDLSAPPWLLPPSAPPETLGLTTPPGSLTFSFTARGHAFQEGALCHGSV